MQHCNRDHDRGSEQKSIDQQVMFHNSVGWYTSVYPIFCSVEDEMDGRANLQYTKNLFRSIPAKGLTFGMCKYLQGEEEIRKFNYKADILFNYLGNRNALENNRLGKAQMLSQHMRSDQSERLNPLELNIYLEICTEQLHAHSERIFSRFTLRIH